MLLATDKRYSRKNIFQCKLSSVMKIKYLIRREDESMQEGAGEGVRPLFRKSKNQRLSQRVQEYMKTHIPYRSWCAHCVTGRGRNDPYRSGGGRRGPREQLTTDSSRQITLMIRKTRGVTRYS